MTTTPKSRESFDRLTDLLRELFQLDRGDLDFGIYRIMNLKSSEIKRFLEQDLLPQVSSTLQRVEADEVEKLEKELHELVQSAKRLGFDPNQSEPIKEIQRQLVEIESDRKAEIDVYNHLVEFFSRYYAEGDFLTLRRYSSKGQSTFLVPYDGEEIKLHWANSDQYYIKSNENFGSYIFTVGDSQNKKRVRFEIAQADIEKGDIRAVENNRRRFVLAKKSEAVHYMNQDLIVRFEHRPLTEPEKKNFPNSNRQQERLNSDIADKILSYVQPNWAVLLAASAPTSTNGERTVLDKHLATYTAKNSSDYFIHKDLENFLQRELDFYLKQEVLNLEDLSIPDSAQLIRALARMRAVQSVGSKIITFLSQFENFEKKLWLKKKFVLNTEYLITLDLVPESFYEEIALNTQQINEWIHLNVIFDKDSGLPSNGTSDEANGTDIEFLKENPYLVLDTKHFSRDFKDLLLAKISENDSLDELMDGLLIHGDNYQSLNLVSSRYRNQVDCIYIDPPYNTDTSAILYKNNYKHSSWLSFMESRIEISRGLIGENGILISAIDDTEFSPYSLLLDKTLPKHNRNTVVINHHPAGAGLESSNISTTHEYAIFMLPNLSTRKILVGDAKTEQYSEIGFIRTGAATSNQRSGRPNSFYAVLVNPDNSMVVGAERPPDIGNQDYPKDNTSEGFLRIYPISPDGTERVWRRSYEKCLIEIEQGNILCSNGRTLKLIKSNANKFRPIFSNWTDKKYNAGTYGTNLLKDLLGNTSFSYPKSIFNVMDCLSASTKIQNEACILDFFAGSGTTGHAVINLNRQDNKERKYILVEVGHHFNDVILPRIKKAIYSDKWKNGKPVTNNGVSQFVKYLDIESYEDTLDGLEYVPTDDDLLAQIPSVVENFRLRYSLDAETSKSASLLGDHFSDPFTYTLSVVRDGRKGKVSVDLPETFNYLIGLRVNTRRIVDDILTITGTDALGRLCLILWRNLKKTNNPKLEKWLDSHLNTFNSEFDRIYVNGDHTLNTKGENQRWIADSIEPIFRDLMFDNEGHGF